MTDSSSPAVCSWAGPPVWLLWPVFHYCWLFIKTHFFFFFSATAAITFSVVVRIRALSPFWLSEWDNLSVKERLAGQERRLKLSTDPSPRHNSSTNVSVELVSMLHWMKVWAWSPDKQSLQYLWMIVKFAQIFCSWPQAEFCHHHFFCFKDLILRSPQFFQDRPVYCAVEWR